MNALPVHIPSSLCRINNLIAKLGCRKSESKRFFNFPQGCRRLWKCDWRPRRPRGWRDDQQHRPKVWAHECASFCRQKGAYTLYSGPPRKGRRRSFTDSFGPDASPHCCRQGGCRRGEQHARSTHPQLVSSDMLLPESSHVLPVTRI